MSVLLVVVAFFFASCNSVWKADIEGKASVEYDGTATGSVEDEIVRVTESIIVPAE